MSSPPPTPWGRTWCAIPRPRTRSIRPDGALRRSRAAGHRLTWPGKANRHHKERKELRVNLFHGHRTRSPAPAAFDAEGALEHSVRRSVRREDGASPWPRQGLGTPRPAVAVRPGARQHPRTLVPGEAVTIGADDGVDEDFTAASRYAASRHVVSRHVVSRHEVLRLPDIDGTDQVGLAPRGRRGGSRHF